MKNNMKQHITIEQLNELSDEGKERLRGWWKPQEGDWFSELGSKELFHQDNDTGWWLGYSYVWVGDEKNKYEFDSACQDLKKHCLPLLSIGQMIEFLYDKCNRVQIWGKFEDGHGCEFYKVESPELTGCGFEYERKELRDTLWSAVREILEKE